jgi:hypothetical protein
MMNPTENGDVSARKDGHVLDENEVSNSFASQSGHGSIVLRISY